MLLGDCARFCATMCSFVDLHVRVFMDFAGGFARLALFVANVDFLHL